MNQGTHPEELPAEVLDDVASVVGAEVTLLSRLPGGLNGGAMRVQLAGRANAVLKAWPRARPNHLPARQPVAGAASPPSAPKDPRSPIAPFCRLSANAALIGGPVACLIYANWPVDNFDEHPLPVRGHDEVERTEQQPEPVHHLPDRGLHVCGCARRLAVDDFFVQPTNPLRVNSGQTSSPLCLTPPMRDHGLSLGALRLRDGLVEPVRRIMNAPSDAGAKHRHSLHFAPCGRGIRFPTPSRAQAAMSTP
jgi:hypothetical protein